MTLRTFLVEDSATIRASLVSALEELGNADVVAMAETELDATAWLRANPDEWELAVVDLFLREGSGLGVLASCHDRRAHQRIAILTNYATETIRRRCHALAADGVFDKSTELDAFLAFCTGAPGLAESI